MDWQKKAVPLNSFCFGLAGSNKNNETNLFCDVLYGKKVGKVFFIILEGK